MSLVKINDNKIAIKEHNGQRVITLKEIDYLHDRKEGSAKRNFHNNRERLVEGEDYFLMPLSEFREKFTPNYVLPGNPHIEVALLTEMGYLMLVKTFSDQLAWSVQRALVNNYFRVKPAATPVAVAPAGNQFDVLRSIIDMLEDTSKKTVENTTAIQALEQKVTQIIDKVDSSVLALESVRSDTYFSPNEVAARLQLFSKGSIPHSQLVNAIARRCGIRMSLKQPYQDEYVHIVKEYIDDEVGTFIWKVSYTLKGLDKIANWFDDNKDKVYYEDFYKRDSANHKKGDLKRRGYKIGNLSFTIESA